MDPASHRDAFATSSKGFQITQHIDCIDVRIDLIIERIQRVGDGWTDRPNLL